MKDLDRNSRIIGKVKRALSLLLCVSLAGAMLPVMAEEDLFGGVKLLLNR